MFLTLALSLQFITNGYPLKCICQFLVAASEPDYAFDASLINALKKKKKYIWSLVFKEQFETLRRHLMKTVLKFPNFALRRREEKKKTLAPWYDKPLHLFILWSHWWKKKALENCTSANSHTFKRRWIFEGMMIGELVFFFFPGYAFAFYFFKLKSLLSVFLLTFNVNVKGGGV